MYIILTDHVKSRRKKGKIPPQRLIAFATYLINEHNLKNKEDGRYKFRRKSTSAIISKKKEKFTFITFFGGTGWLIDSDDFSGFNCVKQTDERVKLSIKRSKEKNRNKVIEEIKPLQNLNAEIKEKLKRDTFQIDKLRDTTKIILKAMFGNNPEFLFLSKFKSYNLVSILRRDGGIIKTVHKNKLIEIGVLNG